MDQLDLDLESPPPAPETAYAVGINTSILSGPHAVQPATIVQPDDPRDALAGAAVCGEPVTISTIWGDTWDDCLASHGTRVCLACLWSVAVEHDTTERVLRLLTPAEEEAAVLARACGNPAPAAAVCRAILASSEHDTEAPLTLQLLAHATAHAPFAALADEDCAEQCCDHDNPADCYPGYGLCNTCSVTAGPWAGEYEGQIAAECCVLAACSALWTLARHYGVALTLPDLTANLTSDLTAAVNGVTA